MNIRQFWVPVLSRPQRSPPGAFYDYSMEDSSVLIPTLLWVAERLDFLPPSTALIGGKIFDQTGREMRPSSRFLAMLERYVATQRQNAHVDYNDPISFLAYDILYFYRNFLKCLFAAHHIRSCQHEFEFQQRISDIGCGVGTFSVACYLMEAFPKAEYLLFDQSFFQLFLAEELSKRLGCRELFNFEKRNVFGEFDRRGSFITSYWLCGNKRQVLERSDNELRKIIRDGLVLVDYQSNVFEFMQRIEDLGQEMKYLELHSPIDPQTAGLVGSRDLSVHLLIVEPR